MYLQVITSGEGEDCTDGREFSDRGKCVEVIDTGNLGEALGDESGLVPDDVARGVAFGSKNPLRADDVDTRRRTDKCPCPVLLQCG
jgi:hypothetical protein